jgi:hypothetical protein
MNIIFGPILIAVILFFVLLGKSGARSAGAYLRRNGMKIFGYLMVGFAVLLAARGAWQAALMQGGFGAWFIVNAKMAQNPGWNPFSRILESYLDRRFPGWRQNLNRNPNARGRRATVDRGVMTEEEAYQILGLEFGASREAILHSYRSAMKKVHPDQGGSTDLAVRLNQARDVLMRRHF